ncbi:putative disease resistance protein RGA4 [Nicotiana sylvestris]|uniref:putative disease resistance protein RGA4 n=1 Tax=Nicotiana sylvestris TaxID=4096 RepID=UPI00388CB34C
MGQLTCLKTLQFFKVGLEQGRRIKELGHLKNLGGELTINGLQLVCNREEAQTAYLQENPNIIKLAYLWSHDEPEGCEINYEYVLDGLQPHPNLKTLAVVDYLGTRFPAWLREDLLPYLVNLKLSGCKKCKEVPSLGQLKLLRHLELVGFHETECIAPTFYGVEVSNNGSSSDNANIQVFPLLKELVLDDMPSLTEWKGVELIPTENGGRDGVGVRMFPGLEKLRIRNFPLSIVLFHLKPNVLLILHQTRNVYISLSMWFNIENLCSFS